MSAGFLFVLNIYMNLSINDLANVKQAIELAAKRGAFQASEMKLIGESYDNLCAFLESVVAQNAPTTSNPQGESNDS
jgi:hypothetical protein